MSKRHQSSRRRTYGRRQHELHERRERSWSTPEPDREQRDEAFAPADATVQHRVRRYGATWIGLE